MPRESDVGHTRQSLSRGSLSGDLLGKFSAIVRPRRTSHAGDNNGGDAEYADDAADPSSPSDGEGTAASSKAFGFMRRFSRATTPFAVVAEEPSSSSSSLMALRRMLEADEPERQRRYDLEAMSFALLHDHLAPRRGLAPELAEDDDLPVDHGNQVEEELHRAVDSEDASSSSDDQDAYAPPARRKSRETTTDADDFATLEDDDDDDGVLVLRLKSRADLDASASHEDDDEEEDDDDDQNDSDRVGDDDAGLNFDPEHLPSSVRKLVRQIENASFQELDAARDAGSSGASGASNQDDEDHAPPCPTKESDPTAKETFAPRLSDPLAHGKAASRRITYPSVAATRPHQFHAPPPVPAAPFLPAASCYIPMDEVQEDLTKSMRRLVIGLQREVENEPTTVPFTRRRGNSCPQPYCAPPSRAAPRAEPTASPSVPQAAPRMVSMDLTEPPPRWRKRSTLARLAPKFLDTFRRKRKSYLYTDQELETIEGARWKIVELAFRFGGKHRAYLVQAVNMFFPLIKYGRHGGPHATRLHCNRCGTLQWQHKRGGLSDAVDLADVLQILGGRQTAVFRKYVSCPELDVLSLSLVFQDRTLDLETQSASHRDWLMSALRTLVAYAKKQRQAEHRAIAEQALLTLEDLSDSSASTRSRDERIAHVHSPDGSNVHGGGPVMLW